MESMKNEGVFGDQIPRFWTKAVIPLWSVRTASAEGTGLTKPCQRLQLLE